MSTWFGIFHCIDRKADTCPGTFLLSRVGFVHPAPLFSSAQYRLAVSSLPTGLRASSGCAEMGLPGPGLWLKRFWVLLQVVVHVAVGKVCLILFPERVKQHILAMNQKNPHFSYDNWAPTFYSMQYFWFVLKVRWQRLEDRTEPGGLAPNCPVVQLSGQRCNIWDFMHGEETVANLRCAWNGGVEVGGEVGWEVRNSPTLAALLFGFLSSSHFLKQTSRFCSPERHRWTFPGP